MFAQRNGQRSCAKHCNSQTLNNIVKAYALALNSGEHVPLDYILQRYFQNNTAN